MSGEKPDNPPIGSPGRPRSGEAQRKRSDDAVSDSRDAQNPFDAVQSVPAQFEPSRSDQFSSVGGSDEESSLNHQHAAQRPPHLASQDSPSRHHPYGQAPPPGWQHQTNDGQGLPPGGPYTGGGQSGWNDGYASMHTHPMMRPPGEHWAAATQTMPAPDVMAEPKTLVAKAQHFFKKHGDKMWWLHSSGPWDGEHSSLFMLKKGFIMPAG